MFLSVFSSLDECVPEEERQRTENAFESFCLSTPWGARVLAFLLPVQGRRELE